MNDGTATPLGSHRTWARWIRVGLKVAMVVVSTAITGLIGEVALRSYLYRKGIGRGDVAQLLKQSDQANGPTINGGTGLFGLVKPSEFPAIVYELRANLHGQFLNHRLLTNSFGLRSGELTLAKPPGTFRIVGLGDSHMFGWEVHQGETYMERLERKLNDAAPPGRRFELLNFGTPGYNTAMEVATLEHRALPFDPDLVVIHFVGNDMIAPHFAQPVRTWVPSDWYLVELARTLTGHEESESEQNEAYDRRSQSGNYSYLHGARAFKTAMKRLKEVCDERHIPVVLLILGDESKQRRYVISYATTLSFHVLEATSYFDAHLASLGYELTVDNALRVLTGENGVPSSHPSSEGHAAYAGALFAELSKMGILLPGSAISPGAPESTPGGEPNGL